MRSYALSDEAPVPATVTLGISMATPLQLETAGLPANGVVRLEFTPNAAPLNVRVTLASPLQPITEEVGVFDGWSDEEERVFLAEEVSFESSDEEDDPYPRRLVTRRRWCLGGCDCERPAGSRKCGCERKGSRLCGKQCSCDPTKCRARMEDSENED